MSSLSPTVRAVAPRAFAPRRKRVAGFGSGKTWLIASFEISLGSTLFHQSLGDDNVGQAMIETSNQKMEG